MQDHPTTKSEMTYEPREVKRNFTLFFMDVSFFLGGFAFLDTSTVLPTFISTLTTSSLVIGLITAIRNLGLVVPQLWAAHYLQQRPKHMRFLLGGAAISRVAMVLFAVMLFFCGPKDKGIMLAGLIVMYSAFWLSEGLVGVSWLDIVAKTIPERRRGALFGGTQVGGGILASISAVWIAYMLSGSAPAYPRNYAIMMAVAAVCFWSSLISLSFVREPDGVDEESRGNFKDFLGHVWSVLKSDSQLRLLLLVQLLVWSFSIATPFYVLFAQEKAGMPASMVGRLLNVQIFGTIVISGLAGWVNDRRGPKSAILVTCISGICAPVFAMIAGPGVIWPFWVVFFFVGGAMGSCMIGVTTFLYEMVNPKDQKSYLGILNTGIAPTALFPVLGGLIAQVASYQAVFVITGILMVFALIATSRLRLVKAGS